MKDRRSNTDRRTSPLRDQAEARLAGMPPAQSEQPPDTLLHELQVHQIELEMQNEALLQAQVELEASRDRYVDLYEFAPVGYFTLTAHGLVEAVNLTGASLLGVERKKLLQHRFDLYVSPEDRERWQRVFVSILSHESPDQVELALLRPDASRFHARLECRRMVHGDDPPVVRIALADISEYKHSEQALQHQTALLKLIMDAIPDLIFVKGPDGTYLACNKAFEAFAGRPAAEQIGKTDFDFFDPDTAQFFRDMDRKMMDSGQTRSNEEWVTYPDGHQVLLDTLKTPFRSPDHALLGLVGISRDVTERNNSSDQIKHLNRVLRTISACNEDLVRARSEEELLDDICRDIVNIGGYLLAWIAEADPAASGSNRPIAWAGNEQVFKAHGRLDHDPEHLRHCIVQLALDNRSAQLCNRLNETPNCTFGALSELGVKAELALPLLNDGQLYGVLNILSTQSDNFDTDELSLMQELANDLAYGIAALRTTQQRDHYMRHLEQAMRNTVIAMARTLEMRDPYTAGHQQRVTDLAVAIAQEMTLAPELIEGLRFGGMIHDIGKISVPAEILSKPGKLTPIEYQLIQQHPETGRQLVADIDFPWPMAQMIGQHHERLDGSGYPAGLKDGKIILEARILAVADVVEAMSSHRPYRASLGLEAALAEIEQGSGRIYDPLAVAACVKVVRENGMSLPE